jgi:sugar (pentulose or hexulose) kinase
MDSYPVIAIFDIGKTNKKIFLFNSNYEIVYQKSVRLIETTDEDGDPCENLDELRLFIFDSLREIYTIKDIDLKAINFSTYGASLIYLDEQYKPITHLYNYLKFYPQNLKEKFYNTYGGEEKVSLETASPVLGSLNSGMQIYRLKHQKPKTFERIKYVLHLPQYLSFLFTNLPCSEITSIGCHTMLWDFSKNDYHSWVYKENISSKLPSMQKTYLPAPVVLPNKCITGIGIHDSSAALIPYLMNNPEPFILLSTGTWNICFNPFNNIPITVDELKFDCLFFLNHFGQPIKASRLFSGYQLEEEIKRIAEYFNDKVNNIYNIEFDSEIANETLSNTFSLNLNENFNHFQFSQRDLHLFSSKKYAYHQLLLDLAIQQYFSIRLVMKGTLINKIFVDGGLSKNSIYMNYLASFFPNLKVYSATVAQSTALGAALVINSDWNTKTLYQPFLKLKEYDLRWKRFSGLNINLNNY